MLMRSSQRRRWELATTTTPGRGFGCRLSLHGTAVSAIHKLAKAPTVPVEVGNTDRTGRGFGCRLSLLASGRKSDSNDTVVTAAESERAKEVMRHVVTLLLLAIAMIVVACSPLELAPILNPQGVEPFEVRYFAGDPADAWRHSADVYLPVSGGDWPVAVVIHGGAWVTNDKRVVDNIGYQFANDGIATVCPNYRLFPQHRYPAQVQDVVRAVAWAKRELPKYGANANDFTLIGYSAGALPVALATLDPKHLASVGLHPDRDLTRVIVMSGIYNVPDLPLVPRQVFTNRVATWRDASPLAHVRANAPPMLILRAERDWSIGVSMKRQSIEFYEAMKRAGADVTIEEIPGCDHDHVEAQVGRDPASETYRAFRAFIRRTSGPRSDDN